MLKIRRATDRDWARLFSWRNDPEASANSFSGPVEIEEHLGWVKAVLADESILLLVAVEQSSGSSVGMCRIDRLKSETTDKKKRKDAPASFEVSIAVDSRFRGRGFGMQFLGSAFATFKSTEDARFVAKIKTKNVASLRLFVEFGFDFVEESDGVVVLAYERLKQP